MNSMEVLCDYIYALVYWFKILAIKLNWSFIFRIILPSGFDKPYTSSEDETTRIRDCQVGQCMSVINLGGEVTCID